VEENGMAIKNSDKAAFWQQHLADFRASGLSRVTYCREHGLKVHQLGYQLDRAGNAAKAKAKSAFARVALPKVAARAEQRAARLVFGGGICLELDGGADAAWIAELVAAVGGAQ
jgi:hypothetical protein